MADIHLPIPSSTVDPTEEAYQASLADINAVPEALLIPITLDAVTVATSLFGSLPQLRALRGQIAATWREFNLERFDKLEQYGLALTHAHAIHNGLTKPKVEVAEKAAELTRLRDRLYGLALPLVDFGLFDASALAKCKVGLGYRPLIEDVVTLVAVYRERWAALEGKVPLRQEELLHAKTLALWMMHQVGLRDQVPAAAGEAALIRHKAFTLFIRTYEEARRAVAYLRAEHGDADTIAPSFYSLRSTRRRTTEAEPALAATPDNTPTPSTSKSGKSSAVPDTSFTINNAAGLPMGNPFIS